MLYYPQLLTGTVAQFPLIRKESHRNVVNVMADGTTIRTADPGADWVGWSIGYAHLSNAEWSAIEALFLAAQGQLNTFTFLDPTDNLFLWSTDLTNAAWTKDPLLTVVGGYGDPNGGTGAFQATNNGEAVQGLTQTLNAPAALTYCFSVYIQSATPVALTLTATDGVEQTSTEVTAGTGWNRVSLAAKLGSDGATMTFGIELPTGAQITVYGLQAEAQPAASLYKATTDRGGVYTNSRFNQDGLTSTATGVNQVSATVQLYSSVEN